MKKKKNNAGTGIVAILLFFIVIGVISMIPSWIFVAAAVVGVGAIILKVLGSITEEANNKKASPSNPSPLSTVVNNDIRIMQDCVSILNTSENLKTVVQRYDDLIVVLGRLSEYENNPAISFPHELPSATLKRMESEKPQIMNRAIQRAYDGMLRKCAALKTEQGRKDRQLKFFDELSGFMSDFPEETQEFVIDFINQKINDPLTGLEGP